MIRPPVKFGLNLNGVMERNRYLWNADTVTVWETLGVQRKSVKANLVMSKRILLVASETMPHRRNQNWDSCPPELQIGRLLCCSVKSSPHSLCLLTWFIKLDKVQKMKVLYDKPDSMSGNSWESNRERIRPSVRDFPVTSSVPLSTPP